MAISFNLTRTQIAQKVLGKVIGLGNASMASADAETVYQALDLRIKELHKLGLFWRKVTSVPVTFSLSASIATASAGAGDILFPLKVTFTNGTNDDPVYLIGPTDYAAIEDKARSGNPEQVMWKGGSEFIFYPVPLSDGTAKLLYERIADDTSHGAVVDIEVSMVRALVDLIKYDVGDDYGVPEARMNRWRVEAAQAEVDIRKLGAPHIDLLPVAVDNFDDRPLRRESDYGR